jgi:hypothetical protein
MRLPSPWEVFRIDAAPISLFSVLSIFKERYPT